jgi:hypothetical protein
MSSQCPRRVRKSPAWGELQVFGTLLPKEASPFIVAEKRDLQMTIHRAAALSSLIATKVVGHAPYYK